MLFVFIMPAADKYFYPVKQIYVVTYFYLLNLYNTLWPAADNDPIILPDQYTSTNYQMIESTQKILEKLIINHIPNEYTVNY